MIFFKSSSDNIIAFGQPTILSYLLIHEGQERGQFKNSMIYAANIITKYKRTLCAARSDEDIILQITKFIPQGRTMDNRKSNSTSVKELLPSCHRLRPVEVPTTTATATSSVVGDCKEDVVDFALLTFGY